MGKACCSCNTVDEQNDIKPLDSTRSLQKHNYTPAQLARIILIQANFRGLITRKRLRAMNINLKGGGISGSFGQNTLGVGDGQLLQDYENTKVLVSDQIIIFIMSDCTYLLFSKFDKSWATLIITIHQMPVNKLLSSGL